MLAILLGCAAAPRTRRADALLIGNLPNWSYIAHPVDLPEATQVLPSGDFGASIESLRKFLSILLLALFGLPVVSPLFALDAKSHDTALPACCRRNGKHNCMMSVGERIQHTHNSHEFRVPAEKCPYSPTTFTAAHHDPFSVPTERAVYAGLTAHPSGLAQTESKQRISRSRSRQKRGPPSLFSL
jgi:hypothetical protein